MFATTTRSVQPRIAIQAVWAALILAALLAASTVIGLPKSQSVAPAAGPAITIDDRALDGAGFRNAPALTTDDRALDGAGFRNAPAVSTDDRALDGAGFRNAPAEGTEAAGYGVQGNGLHYR